LEREPVALVVRIGKTVAVRGAAAAHEAGA
jgi:hypothetical protein